MQLLFTKFRVGGLCSYLALAIMYVYSFCVVNQHSFCQDYKLAVGIG